MLNFLLRRIQRFILPLKILILSASLAGLIYIVLQTAPALSSILSAGVLLFFVLAILLSFRFSAASSLIISFGLSSLFFLRAVRLFTPLNLALFVVFLLLLGLYLRKK